MTRKTKVYLAGPMTIGDAAVNVRKALDAATELLNRGYAPFVPQLTHFWHFLWPQSATTWLDYDKEWLATCDCMLRLKGKSKGADEEEAFCKEHGIPVFYNFGELIHETNPNTHI